MTSGQTVKDVSIAGIQGPLSAQVLQEAQDGSRWLCVQPEKALIEKVFRGQVTVYILTDQAKQAAVLPVYGVMPHMTDE